MRVGAEVSKDGDVVDLCEGDSKIPGDMKSFLEGGIDVLNAAKQ